MSVSAGSAAPAGVVEQGFGHRASRLALRLLLLYLRLAPQPKAAAFAQPGAQLLGSLLNPQAAASRSVPC